MLFVRLVSCAALLTFTFAFESRAQSIEVLLKKGWAAHGFQQFEEAIRISSECVDQFGGQARRDQSRLSKSPPRHALPVGRISKDSPEAKEALENGILNDAAACLFILGDSLERTSRCPKAKSTYEDLAKLTLARVWDPRGWFWVPSDAALDGLERLKGRC